MLGQNILGGKSQYKHSKLCLLDFLLSSSHSNHISLCFAWNLFFVLTSGYFDVTVCTGHGFTEISPLRINSLEFTFCLKLQLNAVILNIVIQLNTEITNVSHCRIQKDENRQHAKKLPVYSNERK